MPVTSPDNIFFPDVSSPASEITNLSTMAASIQTALGFRTRFDFVWPTITERTAQTGMVDGSRGYQIDTGFDYKYNGTVWRNTSAGLVPIMPVTVGGTGVALGTGGQVNLTAVTSVQINGIFTSEFDNYRVDLDLPTSTANIVCSLQLSSGGTPDTSANYDTQSMNVTGGAAANGQAAAGTAWSPTASAAPILDVSMEFKRPFVAKPTLCIATMVSVNTTTPANSGVAVKLQTNRTINQYDGLTFSFSAGTPSGVIHIYGWNNGAK